MPSIKDLRKRITSVKNTQQTTKAMKMVSAAKLRRAQEAILAHRPYANGISSLMEQMSGLGSVASPLIQAERPLEATNTKPRVLLVLVTSDRGLCGGFNSNAIKSVQRWIAAKGPEYSEIGLACVGRRGHDFFKTRKAFKVANYLGEFGGKVTFLRAKSISQTLQGLFAPTSETGAGYDEIKLVYNEFKNAVTQTVVVRDYLPLKPKATQGGASESDLLMVRPSAPAILGELLEKSLVIQVYRTLLESQAGEHGARMSAMENATKNAGEMIRKLTLQYNKQRQAGITKELLEIISGSESQKSAS
jgi:F-type H+-transporting ATPase subunit gamma